MSIVDLLRLCEAAKIHLYIEEGQLKFRAPKGALTEEIRDQIKQSKQELITHLNRVAAQAARQLSHGQRALWYQQQLTPQSSAYNLGFSARVVSAFDPELFKTAVEELARRHPILRTLCRVADGDPYLYFDENLAPSFTAHDVARSNDAELKDLVQRCNGEPFDLAHGPIVRTHIFKRSEQDHVILLSVPHIACDGWSMGLLLRDLRALLELLAARRPVALGPVGGRYSDFIAEQIRMLETLEGQRLKKYWTTQLAGEIPILDLPLTKPRPAVRSDEGATHYFDIGQDLYRQVKALAQAENATLYTVLLSAFQVLLMRYSGQEDIPVGTPVAGRDRSEHEQVVGLFINQVVMRGNLSGNPAFRELLERNRRVILDGLEHQAYPFPLLVRDIQPYRDPSCHPLFQVLFNLLRQSSLGSIESLLDGTAHDTPMAFGPFKLKPFNIPQQEGQFDLALEMLYSDELLITSFRYRTDILDAATIDRMARRYGRLLADIVADPGKAIWDLALEDESDRRRFHEAAGLDPAVALPLVWHGPLTSRVEDVARRLPESTAITEAAGDWRYADVARISNRIAHRLMGDGIAKGDCVAILGHRSAGLALSLLGILKAGAAFLVLDPAYPEARLIKMLQAAKPSGIIFLEAAGQAGPELMREVNAEIKCRFMLPRLKQEQLRALADAASETPCVDIGPEDSAYTIFTSGTTGEPKGIVGTHRPLSHFMEWHCRAFAFRDADRFSMLSGLAHDPLLRDIFAPLWVGGALCIPEQEEMLAPEKLRDWMRKQSVSVSHMTPAMSQVLTEGFRKIDEGEQPLATLRYIFFGGDLLTRHHIDAVRVLAPAVQCVNFYGTTETPQAMGYYVAPPNGADGGLTYMPLGRGIEGAQLIILNPAGRLCGAGEFGEIHVRTPYLSKGYLNDAPLTEKKYIRNPFAPEGVEDKLYKTGDLGRYASDGVATFHGRKDRQVSVRGFRVELGEIEAVLKKINAVGNCAVTTQTDQVGGRSIVAFYVPNDGNHLPAARIRELLLSELPIYMVPSHYVELKSIPLTPNGKIDSRQLQTIKLEPIFSSQVEQPETELEMCLAKIWKEVLGLNSVSVHDNFFDLGGHSLLTIQVITKLEKEIGIRVNPREFVSQTLGQIAFSIERKTISTVTEEKSNKKIGFWQSLREKVFVKGH